MGLRSNGQVYRAGAEGEPIRGSIQNGFHKLLRQGKAGINQVFGTDLNTSRPANFRVLDNNIVPYGRVGTPRRFTLY